jgi:hypothetical protein
VGVKVNCVVKTECEGGKADIVELKGGLRITPYHPIRINGKFFFPSIFADVVNVGCPYVYSFVLDKEHIMTINGIQCVTMGHNFVNDNVVRHPYFGSQAVIKDLSRLRGWNRGLVEINNEYILRDSKTGLMAGIKKPSMIGKIIKRANLFDLKNSFKFQNLISALRRKLSMIKI